jgi:hypothetical protein
MMRKGHTHEMRHIVVIDSVLDEEGHFENGAEFAPRCSLCAAQYRLIALDGCRHSHRML